MVNLLRLLTSRRARNDYRGKRISASKPTHVELREGKFERAIIATVAFNRPDIVEWQIRLVRKNVAEYSGYIVFDNSNDPRQRQAVRAVCQRESVPYVGLPHVGFTLSSSHGAALNWITQNFVARYRPALFGFIDHDIFPMQPVSMADRIHGAKVYGMEVNRAETRYLWGGFCFFSGVDPAPLDFAPIKLPHVFLDTGGSNWNVLYRYLDPNDFRAATVGTTLTTPGGVPFDEMDGWLHAGQAGWQWEDYAKDRTPLLEARLIAAYGTDAPRIAMLPI